MARGPARRASWRRPLRFCSVTAQSKSRSVGHATGPATKQQRRAGGLGSGQALGFTRLRGAGSLAAVRARACAHHSPREPRGGDGRPSRPPGGGRATPSQPREGVAQRPRARGTPTSVVLLLRRPGIDQAPDKRQLIRLLQRPDRGSHAFTLGLCDGLNAKAAVAVFAPGAVAGRLPRRRGRVFCAQRWSDDRCTGRPRKPRIIWLSKRVAPSPSE